MNRIPLLLTLVLSAALSGACTRPSTQVPIDAETARLMIRRDSLNHVRQMERDSVQHARSQAATRDALALATREGRVARQGIIVLGTTGMQFCVADQRPAAEPRSALAGKSALCEFTSRAAAVTFAEALAAEASPAPAST